MDYGEGMICVYKVLPNIAEGSYKEAFCDGCDGYGVINIEGKNMFCNAYKNLHDLRSDFIIGIKETMYYERLKEEILYGGKNRK